MIKVTAFYPNAEGKSFDAAYYLNKHVPMVKQMLGPACKRVDIEQGLGGMQPGSKPAYVMMGHMLFDSVDDFQAAFGPNADAILADIPNYTDIQPVIQVSEVKA